MNKVIFILIIILQMSCGDLLDEEPPTRPRKLGAYFTMSDNKPRVHLSWDKPSSDDISEYHIFRSMNNSSGFDSLTSISKSNQTYDDTTVSWLDTVYYKIRAEDRSTNIGSFSDSVYVFCYKSGGNWSVDGFDSLFLCVDPSTYSTPEIFRIVLDMPLDSIGDTAGIMDFNEIFLDTNLWTGNGWMYYTYSVLEPSDDTLGFDTVTYANTVAPEFCTINLSNPNNGIITFDSDKYNSVTLEHSVTACNGDTLFP